MKILGLDHVQVAAPHGSEGAARRFYGGVLGLEEVPKPASMAVRGGLWFQCGPHQLHVGVESEFRPATKAHPALVVDGLDGLAISLVDAGYEVRQGEELPGRRRLFVDDPFGNRLELVELLDG